MKHLVGHSFFDSLVTWDELETLLEHVEEHEKEEAAKMIASSIDCAVMETVFHHLPHHHHHQFLELCHDQYHEPSVLIWLEEKVEGITHHLKQTIVVTHDGIKEVLTQEVSYQE
jgi:hypothetical protein